MQYTINFDTDESLYYTKQETDFALSVWNVSVGCHLKKIEWRQSVDLASGVWNQQYFANGVLVWEDSWNMDFTAWDLNEDENLKRSSIAMLA